MLNQVLVINYFRINTGEQNTETEKIFEKIMVNQNKIFSFKIKWQANTIFQSDIFPRDVKITVSKIQNFSILLIKYLYTADRHAPKL